MIELKEFKTDDFDNLISWINNEKLLIQFAGPIFKYPLDKDQLNDYIIDSNRIPFTVFIAGKKVGHAEIYKNDDKTIKLCRILVGDIEYRGKGIGQEIIKELINYSFDKLETNTVELNVYDWNISAIKCYEKVGFVINKSKTTTIQYKNETWTAINMTFNKTNLFNRLNKQQRF